MTFMNIAQPDPSQSELHMNSTETHGESYQELHKPSSEFATRSDYLDNELIIMKPRRWRLNLPGRDFRFE